MRFSPVDEHVEFSSVATPLVVRAPHSVGLQGILDLFSPPERPLQLDDFTKDVEAEQRRLAPVPDEPDDRRRLGLDVLADVGRQDIVRHAEVLALVEQRVLLQVEAVVALDVAHRPDGLGQDVQALGVPFIPCIHVIVP